MPRPSGRRRPNPRTVKWINRELWAWLRARAMIEHRGAGEILNRLIGGYRVEVGWDGEALRRTSYERDITHSLSVRGLDEELWQWLKDRATLEERGVAEVLNELIHRYMEEAGFP